jgi:hypothetical protein
MQGGGLTQMKTKPTGHAPTDAWLAKQPIWHDRDIIKATLTGIVVGVLFGFIWGYGVGLPDYGSMTLSYLRG